jgi:hypothetical protein
MAKAFSVSVSGARTPTDHAAGFNAALDKALDQASRRIGTGEFTVDVQFWAKISVTNPGTIQQYGVTLTPRG